MQRRLFPFIILTSVLFLCGCSQSQVSVKAVMTGNSNPPVLLEVVSTDSRTIRLVFDKQVHVFGSSFEPFEAGSDGYWITVKLPSDLSPGKQVTVSGRVEDEAGNTSGFTTPVWGYNSNLAGMLINEVATKDEPKTEILITSDGNIAGAVLYNGIPSGHEGMAILPDSDVSEGDFIVVWWTEEVQGNDSEHVINVKADTALQGKGYSNNGIQTLAESPAEGAIVSDCIVYSNGSSTFGGFGNSSTEARVKKAVEKQWWNGKPVDSRTSTKTRTMSRYLNCPDTDSCEDWYVVRTSGASFGEPNTSEPYVPD